METQPQSQSQPQPLRTIDLETPTLLTRNEMETRRLLAAEDLANGVKQAAVARKFGVSRTTTSRWNETLREKGQRALAKSKPPGRTRKLSADQEQELAMIYHGEILANVAWTTQDFADLILGRFGVRYNRNHIGRIMHRLQLPVRHRGGRGKARITA